MSDGSDPRPCEVCHSCSISPLSTLTIWKRRSRRLIGLDPENSLALDRAIVLHGADYVSETMARDTGRVGRSLGCFAVAQDVRDTMIGTLGEGRLLYCGKAA